MDNNATTVYIHPDVSQVWELHAAVIGGFDFAESILDLLDRLAMNLARASAVDDPRASVEIKNFLRPGEYDIPEGGMRLGLKEAREIMARQHGFADWEEVKIGGRATLQQEFEMAVDYLVSGNTGSLERMLDENPHLVLQRSAYFHKASLLHYVSANGVEIRRQTVPGNLAGIASLLIERGADPEARGFFYGRMMDTVSLLRTGSHTKQAGVYEKIRGLFG